MSAKAATGNLAAMRHVPQQCLCTPGGLQSSAWALLSATCASHAPTFAATTGPRAVAILAGGGWRSG